MAAKYKIIVLMLVVLAARIQASDITVHLPEHLIPSDVIPSNAMILAVCPSNVSLPFPLGMFGAMDKDVLNLADTVIVASVVEVVPIGITGLDEWYFHRSGHVIWYRVKCEVKDIIRGKFPFSSIKFVTCYGSHRVTWPYVKGFCYRFGMDNQNGKWIISAQVRACPFLPYSLEDHVAYDNLIRRKPSIDLTRWNALIGETEKFSGARCLDVSVEKNKFLIMTFAGHSVLGDVDVDYGQGATWRVFSWATQKELGKGGIKYIWDMTVEDARKHESEIKDVIMHDLSDDDEVLRYVAQEKIEEFKKEKIPWAVALTNAIDRVKSTNNKDCR